MIVQLQLISSPHLPRSFQRDQVEWDPELEQYALEAVERQKKDPVPEELQKKFNENPAAQWDQFYAHNKGTSALSISTYRVRRVLIQREMRTDNFFKERAWLQNEFPELEAVLQPDVRPFPHPHM